MLEVNKMNKKHPGDFLYHNGAYCPSCYCNSVELYENGEKRCTICAWNLTKGEYEPFELSDACERLHYTRMLCHNCNNVHGILLRESINLFELSDENDVKKSSQPVENKDGLNVK